MPDLWEPPDDQLHVSASDNRWCSLTRYSPADQHCETSFPQECSYIALLGCDDGNDDPSGIWH